MQGPAGSEPRWIRHLVPHLAEVEKKRRSVWYKKKKKQKKKKKRGVWRENKTDGGWWRSAHVRTLRLQGITSQRNTSCCSIFSRRKEKRSPPEEHRGPLEGRSGSLCVFQFLTRRAGASRQDPPVPELQQEPRPISCRIPPKPRLRARGLCIILRLHAAE